jgi:hypothetical protein
MPYLSSGPLGLFHEGKSLVLEPKRDMTAYELYQIGIFKENCKLNKHPEAIPHLIQSIDELNIRRHFKESSYVQG